jgi:stage II sporulation protein AA (anti-sigma F factor antagonist)
MNTIATLHVSQVGEIPIVAIEGEIDIGNVIHLRPQIVRAVPNSAPGFVLDLSRTSYLDSRGVHLILEIADRMATSQQQLRVVVPEGALVRRVLSLAHVDATVPIDPSVERAIEALRSSPSSPRP